MEPWTYAPNPHRCNPDVSGPQRLRRERSWPHRPHHRAEFCDRITQRHILADTDGCGLHASNPAGITLCDTDPATTADTMRHHGRCR